MTGSEQAFWTHSRRGLALVALCIAIIFAGAGFVYVFSGDGGASRRSDCVEAVAAADELIDATAEGIGIMQQMFDAISAFDLDHLEDLADQLEAATPPVRELRADYDDKAKECRG